MPCLFLDNVPEGTMFTPAHAFKLHQRIADAVGCTVPEVEIHITNKYHTILKPTGKTEPAPDVHAFIEWHGRSFEVKERVAKAVADFLSVHGFNSDLTFRDSEPGTFFINGELVGEPPEDNIRLA